MSQSALAQSPAIVTIQNDFVDEMLAGNAKANEAEAGVVAGLYFLFLLLSLFNVLRDRRPAHILLMLFCSIRVVCFSVRAYMQTHLTENLAIVYEVFFSVGFVALVKLLVSLLTAWTLPKGVAPKRNQAFRLGLLQNHGTLQERFITILLIVGAITTIIGSTSSYQNDATVKEYNKGLSLMKAGYTLYLVAIVLFDILVLTGPLLNRMAYGPPRSIRSATVLVLGLEVAGLLLTCKAVFQVIAIYTNPSLTFRNKLFYPLEVLPELLVLCILCAPGFINHLLQGSHAYPEHDTAAKHLNGVNGAPHGTKPSPVAAPATNGTTQATHDELSPAAPATNGTSQPAHDELSLAAPAGHSPV